MKRPISTLVALISTMGLLSGCFIEGKWKPPGLPISFGLNTNGEIKISGETSVVTPLGQFGIEAGSSRDFDAHDGGIVVVIRHLKDGLAVDDGYELGTDKELRVKADGLVEVGVTDDKIFVDASGGDVTSITIGNPDDIGSAQSLADQFYAFNAALHAADQRSDLMYLVDRLDPAVFTYYTRQQCIDAIAEYLGEIIGPPDRVASFVGPGPTDYFYDDSMTKKITVQNSYLVTFDRPPPSRQIIGRNGARFTWITPCGEFAQTD